MTALNKQALRQLATDAHELGIIKRYTKGIEANKRFVAIATPLTVLALLDELEAAESKCRELAADNQRAMDSLKQADAAVKLAHEKFSALADENMALKSGHYNGMVLPETPATDAFLAEVRAGALPAEVMAAIQKVARIRLDLNDFDGDNRGIIDCLGEAEESLIEIVNKFAAQLRKGAAL
ncbi:hypothetical protein [Citrobacter sp. CRE-46]|uniref:hypothetical protein n=1 Tax=Citrobacter sp. CRE-46 TaxID=1703250 RepID=UPI000D7CC374|nr:hypothetical protein [Citrobacter sp. CRE-46]AWS97535.1 hypothetical protein AN232_21145 [Citrobacter sp. CRE-46]AWS97586.1 hypothetical protein AN232_21440 [Citrobacter sp. CRE-46]